MAGYRCCARSLAAWVQFIPFLTRPSSPGKQKRPRALAYERDYQNYQKAGRDQVQVIDDRGLWTGGNNPTLLSVGSASVVIPGCAPERAVAQ